MRFLPVEITLEPRESINSELGSMPLWQSRVSVADWADMGIMQMDVLSAHNLHAADRGGKSDVSSIATCEKVG